MLLDMPILSDHLADIAKSHIAEDYRRSLRGVRIFRSRRKSDWDSYVYLVSEEESKKYNWENDNTKKRLIFINPLEFSEEQWQDEEYLCLKTERTIEDISEEIQGIFEWYGEWERTLLEAKFAKKGLQEILNIASEAFPNPIAVFDNATRLLAWAGQMPEKRDALWDMVLTENVAYVSEMTRLYREKNIMLDVEKGKKAAFFILNDAVWPDTMQANIYDPDSGNRLGNLGGTGVAAPLTLGQLSKFDYLAGYMASILARYNRSLNNEKQQLLVNALEGKSVSKELFEQQLFGRAVTEHYELRILNLQPLQGENYTEVELQASLAKYQPIYTEWKCFAAVWKENIVMLIAESDNEEKIDEQIETLICQYPKFTIGISDQFDKIQEASYAFRQAEIAANYGAEEEEKQIHYFRDNVYRYVAGELQKELPLKAICEPDIYRIAQYDKEHETAYLKTLRSYLEYGHNVTRAAVALYIHRNTMIYRIERMKELFGEQIFQEEKTGAFLFSINLIMEV